MKLDYILDNDCFSSKQEREIRKMISYEIKKNDTGYLVLYMIKETDFHRKYYLDKNNLLESRIDLYKDVAFNLINDKVSKLGIDNVCDPVFDLIISVVASRLGQAHLNFKAQEIFRCLVLVCRDEANQVAV